MRRVDEALGAGDFPGFLALHTEDVVMHVPGSGGLRSGDHYGREGIVSVFQREMSMLDAPPETVLLDDLGSDDHAASLVIQRMKRAGRSYEGLQVIIARVRNGQPTRRTAAPCRTSSARRSARWGRSRTPPSY